LATGIPIQNIVQYYIDHGPQVFESRRFSLRGVLRSKYAKQHLRETLGTVFGQKTLVDARTRLVIPATDIANGTVHVFKSPYLESFYRDKNVAICEAVAASCSAPLFFDPELVKPYLLSDGGLWANNPALIAYIEATGKLGIPTDQVRLLSIGTGVSKKYYSIGHPPKWWGLFGWGPLKLVSMILNLQSVSAENMVGLMLQSQQYVRINFSCDVPLPLDDSRCIPDLLSRADSAFTYNSSRIKNLLSMGI
jgi:hypothetical protein